MKKHFLILVMITILFQTILLANPPVGELIQLNSLNETDQRISSSHFFSDGSFYLITTKIDSLNLIKELYLQKFDSNFQKMGDTQFLRTDDLYENSCGRSTKILSKELICYNWCLSRDNNGNYQNVQYAELYNGNGEKIGDSICFSDQDDQSTESLDLISLPDDKILFYWNQYSDDYIYHAQAAIFSGEGNMIQAPFDLAHNSPDTNYMVSEIQLLSDSTMIVINTEASTERALFGQIYNLNGEPLKEKFKINTNNHPSLLFQELLLLDNGNRVVNWGVGGCCGPYDNIFAQLIDAQGNKIGDEFEISNHTESQQCYPRSIVLDNGNFVTSWMTIGEDENPFAVYAQHFDQNAQKIGTETQVNQEIETALNHQIYKFKNNYLITMNRSEYAQLYDLDGNRVGREFSLNLLGNGNPISKIEPIFDSLFVILAQEDSEQGTNLYAKLLYQEPQNHDLTNFEQISPEEQEKTDNDSILFKWSTPSESQVNYPWEITYDLYLDTSETFSDPEIFSNIMDTIFILDKISVQEEKTYYWKVNAKNWEGGTMTAEGSYSSFVVSPETTPIKEQDQKKKSHISLTCYPNPFSKEITFDFSIISQSPNTPATLRIYNLQAKLVKEFILPNPTNQQTKISWDATNHEGEKCASGVYICEITAGNLTKAKKIVLVR